MNTKEIDLSKAPEGATHYNTGLGPTWWKRDARGLTCWSGQLWTVLLPVTTGPLNLVEIPPAPQWNGTGLPPVGTVCEIAASTEYLKVGYPEGTKVKIYANFTDDRGVELAAFVDEIGKVGGIAIAKCFRPIRTPEQIAAEQRKLAIDAMQRIVSSGDPHYGRKVCEALYDAGCRLPADA